MAPPTERIERLDTKAIAFFGPSRCLALGSNLETGAAAAAFFATLLRRRPARLLRTGKPFKIRCSGLSRRRELTIGIALGLPAQIQPRILSDSEFCHFS